MADVALDDTSDGGCGNRRWGRRWLSLASVDSDGGDGMNNREGGRAGEDGGKSSLISLTTYSVEPDT